MDVTYKNEELVKGLTELIRTEGYKEDLYVRPLP